MTYTYQLCGTQYANEAETDEIVVLTFNDSIGSPSQNKYKRTQRKAQKFGVLADILLPFSILCCSVVSRQLESGTRSRGRQYTCQGGDDT